MSRKLPQLTPAEMVKALEKAGFYVLRQTGSHAIVYKAGLPRPIPIPQHARALKRSLWARIIKEAGLAPEEFQDLL